MSGLLDVARQTFKEATEDVHQHVTDINRTSRIFCAVSMRTDKSTEQYEMQAETRYDNSRRYWLRICESYFDGRLLPDILVNRFRRKGFIECQTLDLMKLNQRIEDSHQEVVLMSDKTVQELLDDIRGEIPSLFKVCESIAMLDMIAGFCQLATIQGNYTRPEITEWLAVKSGRHPVREKVCVIYYLPATQHLTRSRFIQRNLSQTMSTLVSKQDSRSLLAVT